jgi:hypothetical protein
LAVEKKEAAGARARQQWVSVFYGEDVDYGSADLHIEYVILYDHLLSISPHLLIPNVKHKQLLLGPLIRTEHQYLFLSKLLHRSHQTLPLKFNKILTRLFRYEVVYSEVESRAELLVVADFRGLVEWGDGEAWVDGEAGEFEGWEFEEGQGCRVVGEALLDCIGV